MVSELRCFHTYTQLLHPSRRLPCEITDPKKAQGQDLSLAPLKRAFLSIESSSALVPSNFGLLYFLESFQSSQKLLGNFRATPKKTQDQDLALALLKPAFFSTESSSVLVP
jgi:hypothetical protein